MQATANRKYAEALAHDIADALNAAPHPGIRVTVSYSHAAETYSVRVIINRVRYELTMPAPGAYYALFGNGRWLGGINLRSDANPAMVALALLDCIEHTL